MHILHSVGVFITMLRIIATRRLLPQIPFKFLTSAEKCQNCTVNQMQSLSTSPVAYANAKVRKMKPSVLRITKAPLTLVCTLF